MNNAGNTNLFVGIDHPAVAAEDVDRLADWYVETLGYERASFARKSRCGFCVLRMARYWRSCHAMILHALSEPRGLPAGHIWRYASVILIEHRLNSTGKGCIGRQVKWERLVVGGCATLLTRKGI